MFWTKKVKEKMDWRIENIHESIERIRSLVSHTNNELVKVIRRIEVLEFMADNKSMYNVGDTIESPLGAKSSYTVVTKYVNGKDELGWSYGVLNKKTKKIEHLSEYRLSRIADNFTD